jgi:hypothetical protein
LSPGDGTIQGTEIFPMACQNISRDTAASVSAPFRTLGGTCFSS